MNPQPIRHTTLLNRQPRSSTLIIRILRIENRLPRLNKQRQRLALVVLMALLDHSKIKLINQLLPNIKRILQPNSKPTLASKLGDQNIEPNLIRFRKRKPGLIREAINVVRLNRIAPLLGSKRHPTLNHA
jgi:hypothetical protein